MTKEKYLLDLLGHQAYTLFTLTKLDGDKVPEGILESANSLVAILESLGSINYIPLYWADLNKVNNFKQIIENQWKIEEIEIGDYKEIE